MEFDLQKGLTGELSEVVSDDNTAAKYGSGGVPVYATPAMIALMEGAAKGAVDKYLPEGYTTVGVSLHVQHMAATPVGMKVTAKAELMEVDGKRLVFKVEAFDEVEKIGEGTHDRYIVNFEKFLQKNAKKLGTVNV